ncbi:MAG: glycosyltransferase family 4 protein [Elusimicrobia bacterium]|nr:glycosyltransferase family 4 protein [Elusimicrobiota bacterium]
MRICFISAGNFAHTGSYLDHFHAAGHEVHFVALSPSPPRCVPTYDLGLGGAYSSGRGKWKYPLSMLRARRLLGRLKPDIVHTHFATSGGLAGLVCGFNPTVVTAHGTDLTAGMKSCVWRPLLKAVFEHAACVNTVSSDLTRMAMSLGIDRRKVVELTPGVDTSRFQSAGRRAFRGDEALRLVCTRRLEPLFDHRTIVEALAILRAKGVEFKMTFAGEGSLRGELEALVKRRGLGDAATFLGAVAGDAMPAVLREHDVYLSSSRADGASLSLLEAMSAGLFPVVSRIPANEAWLEHGVGGFLHGVGDPEDLAARVLELTRRPSLAASAAGHNRGKVIASGDRATNMGRLEKVYEGLLARRSGRA